MLFRDHADTTKETYLAPSTEALWVKNPVFQQTVADFCQVTCRCLEFQFRSQISAKLGIFSTSFCIFKRIFFDK